MSIMDTPASAIATREGGSATRADIGILESALRNHYVTDPEKRERLLDELRSIVASHDDYRVRCKAANALASFEAVNQRREAKLLDILCDRGRDPLPNPAPAAVAPNHTVIGQVNVIAAGDQPASDPMTGLMRLIRSGLQTPSANPAQSPTRH